MSAIAYACTSIFHDSQDCLEAEIPRDEWCDSCIRVEEELEEEKADERCDYCRYSNRNCQCDNIYMRAHDK